VTEVHEVHKHLYHYTNFDGLRGIFESQTLWATHFKGLNDSSEIELMRPLLKEKLFEHFNAIMRKLANESPSNRIRLEKQGGITKASRTEAKNYTDYLYKKMFSGAVDEVPATEPYILSFCAHPDDDDYVKKNGLLSQWRAYGGEGGYALVFDTRLLMECLGDESKNYQYFYFYIGDVLYNNQSDKFETVFADLDTGLKDWATALSECNDPPIEKVIEHLFKAATRFKHRGFEEESEVRVSAAPLSKAIAEANTEIFRYENLKPIQYRKKGDDQVQYIALNEVPKKKPLPIIRIIIGPQRDQKQRAKDVKKLIGKKNIDIVCSETPYLPPQARISN